MCCTGGVCVCSEGYEGFVFVLLCVQVGNAVYVFVGVQVREYVHCAGKCECEEYT